MDGQGSPRTSAKRKPPWPLIGFAAVALYVLLVVVLNRGEVEFNFVFFTTRISKIVLILLCLGLGFAAGFLFDHWRHRRRS